MIGFLKFWKKNSYEFPCKNCLVMPAGCKDLCEKVEQDEEKLRMIEKELSKDKDLICPDCGSTEWYGGPRGGMCQNIMCGRCKHKFNIGPGLMVFQRI
ncbi:MAG: hypothetical protein ACFFG0_01425 [Candidatus Thorarchaeota archaeon]